MKKAPPCGTGLIQKEELQAKYAWPILPVPAYSGVLRTYAWTQGLRKFALPCLYYQIYWVIPMKIAAQSPLHPTGGASEWR